jgi:hypothetical protein
MSAVKTRGGRGRADVSEEDCRHRASQGACSSGAPRSGGSRPAPYRARPRGRPGDPAEVRGARLDVVLLLEGEVVRLTCGIGDALVWEERRVSVVNMSNRRMQGGSRGT